MSLSNQSFHTWPDLRKANLKTLLTDRIAPSLLERDVRALLLFGLEGQKRDCPTGWNREELICHRKKVFNCWNCNSIAVASLK